MEYSTYCEEITQACFEIMCQKFLFRIGKLPRNLRLLVDITFKTSKTQLLNEIPENDPLPEQEYVLRTCVGRMVKQISSEKRVLKFLFVSINKMTWSEFYSKAKR